MSFNKALIMGRLGRDPELKNVNSKSVCEMSVATSKKVKDQEYTEWHSVVVWGKQADACAKYLSKGSQVLVEGEIRTRSWDGQDGQKKYKTEILAQNVQFLSPKQQKGPEVINHAEQIPF